MDSIKSQLRTVYVFSKINTKRFFRDRLSIFFGIAFPLIFLFVFGGIFGSDSNELSFRIGLINQSDTSFAQDFETQIKDNKIFNVNSEVSTIDAATDLMTKSQLDATLVIPKSFGMDGAAGRPSGQLQVIYTQNNQQAATTIGSILSAQFDKINADLTQIDKPYTVVTKQLNQRSLSQFDYTFAGLLGFAIIGLGIFGPVNVFPELKKQGILRRLSTTPLRVWQYFLSTAISQVIIGLVTLSVLFAVAITVFDLQVIGNPFALVVFLIVSILMILGIGLAIGGWAQNERQAAPLSNIVVFPMLFLSGTFFPRFIMPEWLQSISNYIPLTPVIEGVRLIATEGATLIDVAPQLGLILGWLVVIYLLAFRLFKWE